MVTMPLNWDFFTGLVIMFANTWTFLNFNAYIPYSGHTIAKLNTSGPLKPNIIGLRIYFAYFLYWPFDFVSNPVVIEIVP
jgi:hypothetical protein